MKKNKALINAWILMISIVFVIFLGACSPKETKNTKLVLWTDQTQTERKAQLDLLVDTFVALNPEYEVEVVPVDINEFSQQIATSAGSGELPNVLHTTTQFLLSYDEEGLIDTQATQTVIDDLGESNFVAGSTTLSKSVSHQGYFMVPYHFMVQGIWYRKDWFNEAGLDAPNNPDALLKAAKYFYKPEKNQYGVLVGTKAQEQYNEQILLQLATAHNAYLFNKDGSLAIDSPEMLEALEFYKELSKYTPPGPQTWRSRDYYLQGKLAMFFYSSFIMDDLAIQEVAANSLTSENFKELQGSEFDKNLVDNTGFVPGFTWDTESTYAEMNGLSIVNNENKKVIEGSQKLIKFLMEKENYITWIHLVPGGMFPVLKEVINSDEFYQDPKGVYVRYGKEKISSLIKGIENPKAFIIRDGIVFPQAAKVASQLIIPDMIFQITEENIPISEAVLEAKKKIISVLNE